MRSQARCIHERALPSPPVRNLPKPESPPPYLAMGNAAAIGKLTQDDVSAPPRVIGVSKADPAVEELTLCPRGA